MLSGFGEEQLFFIFFKCLEVGSLCVLAFSHPHPLFSRPLTDESPNFSPVLTTPLADVCAPWHPFGDHARPTGHCHLGTSCCGGLRPGTPSTFHASILTHLATPLSPLLVRYQPIAPPIRIKQILFLLHLPLCAHLHSLIGQEEEIWVANVSSPFNLTRSLPLAPLSTTIESSHWFPNRPSGFGQLPDQEWRFFSCRR